MARKIHSLAICVEEAPENFQGQWFAGGEEVGVDVFAELLQVSIVCDLTVRRLFSGTTQAGR